MVKLHEMKDEFFCHYCKSRKTNMFLTIDKKFALLQCSICKLLFTYPQEIIDIVDINNTKYNSKEDEKSYLGIYDQIYKRARTYVKNIQKYKKSGKYLDVGCSYGIYLKAANEAGFETYGVEIAPNAARYAREKFKLNVVTGTVEKAKYKSNTFDVITLYDVLEHIPDLRKFLKEIYKILKPGGLLVIQCPNVESYAFKVLQNDWNWLLVPQHLWHFSPSVLTKILKDHKFSVKEIITWDSVYDFASNWVTKMGLTIPKTSLQRKLIRKGIYFVLYGGIAIGSIIWTFYKKGGEQIIYAVKK